MEMELGPGISPSAIKEPVTPGEWFLRLQYDIKENLLSETQVDDLLDNPAKFLVGYTDNEDIAKAMSFQIIKSYFISELQIKADNQSVRAKLAKYSLDLLDERMSNESGSISPVDLSQIFKNLKKDI